MNNKVLVLSSLILFSTSTMAMDATDHMDKSGHTFYGGVSRLFGDLSDISKDAAFSLGYDYTLKNGLILGGYYTPKLISKSDTVEEITTSVKADSIGFYSGYQFDNNFRLTGGLTFTYSEAKVSFGPYSLSDDQTNVGVNLGGDYLFNNLVIGARLTSYKIADTDGVALGLNLGYKF